MGVNKDQLKRFFKIDEKIRHGKKATIIQLATAWNNSCLDEVEKVTERTIRMILRLYKRSLKGLK